ncbi:MAG: hypothetical protein QOJ29_3080 [Thermoleophilaceae bacterium]|nr:hypothetical protein [Thermoleophilaceae bacterium]
MISASTLAAVPFLASAAPASAAGGSVTTQPTDSTQNVITAQSASVLPLTVQGASGQTSNLQEWQDSSGNALAAVAANGRIEQPDTGAGHGPWTWETGGQSFNGNFDPVSYFGYNVSNYGRPIKTDEPVTAWVLEADYDTGTMRTMEHYLEARSANQVVSMRPLFFQTKRDATTPEEFLQIAEIWGNPLKIGTPRNDSTSYLAPGVTMAEFRKNETFLYSTKAGSDNVLHIQAPAGRNSKIMLGSNGQNDTYRIETTQANRMDIAVAGQDLVRFYGFPGGGGGMAVGGVYDNSASGLFAATPNTTQRAVVARAGAGQSQPIIEVQDSGSGKLGGFDKSGYFFTKKTSAPSDSDVGTGQAFLWFDQSPGNPRLIVKARDANGNIRTGSLQLS